MDVQRIHKLESDILALLWEFENETGFAPYMLMITNDCDTRRSKTIDAVIRPIHDLPFEGGE